MGSIRRSWAVGAATLACALGAQAAGFTLGSATIKPGSMLGEAKFTARYGRSK